LTNVKANFLRIDGNLYPVVTKDAENTKNRKAIIKWFKQQGAELSFANTAPVGFNKNFQIFYND
jgi:hypothetical protein